jgi:ferritin-like metal-binding protein YciE
MNSEIKMRSLFVQHLRTIYDGERLLADVFASMRRTAGTEQLEMFFRERARERDENLERLDRISVLMNASLIGVRDPIIHSIVSDRKAGENDMFRTANTLLGRALNVYQSGAYWTAVSCALEMGEEEIALLLMECLEEQKFDRANLVFINEQEMMLCENNFAYKSAVA